MRQYFQLQFTMFNRRMRDFGINPVIGYMLLTGLFIGFVKALYYRVEEYAPWILIGACLMAQTTLSQKERSDFLQTTFGKGRKTKIRIVENLIISLPFAVALLLNQCFNQIAIIIILSIVSSLATFKGNTGIVIPTPFSKRPFEFSTGFRYTFYLIALVYVITVISVSVNNLNLGIATIVAVYIIAASYYSKPEDVYYVWIFAKTPRKFLRLKVLEALKNVSFMALPPIALLTVFYYTEIYLIIIAAFVGTIFLITMVLAKYSSYPDNMGLSVVIMLILALLFPPSVLVAVPYFYYRSINKLKQFFDD
ncbi:MAG: hypothetical protein J6Y24_06755 [Bacteroidales bacterium]|nr:hypothetical protein [Bacteroidales bacterium]